MSAENTPAVLAVRQAEEDRKSALYVWSADDVAYHEARVRPSVFSVDLTLDANKFTRKSF